MQKYALIAGAALLTLAACDKHDPILAGTRTAIFDTAQTKVLGENVPDLPQKIVKPDVADCPYTQDKSNTIWDGDKKIFSGFATNNSVSGTQTPVCSGGAVYAGLTTGEVVKLNPRTRKILWIADVYRATNMTGGASVVDIVAPIEIRGASVYAGGLGDAFCRINATSGVARWCADIGTAHPFILTDVAAFVVATDNNLYAIRLSDGVAYWRTELDKQDTPTYNNKIITVGHEKFNAENGEKIE